MNPDPVADLVMDLVAEKFWIDRSRVTLDSRIRQDLGGDSLSFIELAAVLEGRIGHDIPDAELAGVRIVGDLVNLARRYRRTDGPGTSADAPPSAPSPP